MKLYSTLTLVLFTVLSSAYADYKGFLWKHHEYDNNCYNYALGIQNNHFQQPGDASGKPYEVMSCDSQSGRVGVVEAAISDGLRLVDSAKDCEYYEQRVALVVGEGKDYHWYRLEDEGFWTHKPGGTPATDMNASGNVITDIETASRGIYTDFCGYFCVNYDDLKIPNDAN